jgi:hypothetical protein
LGPPRLIGCGTQIHGIKVQLNTGEPVWTPFDMTVTTAAATPVPLSSAENSAGDVAVIEVLPVPTVVEPPTELVMYTDAGPAAVPAGT